MQDVHPPVKHNIIIIGAGPAGLAIAGRLRKRGLAFAILEKDMVIASRWHQHYDRLHLHTVKNLSHLPHLPFPEEYPVYVSRQQLVDYYTNYAIHFDIKPIFDIEVKKIEKKNGHWQLLTNGQVFETGNVIIATGSNRSPVVPRWKGQEVFSGEIIHSRDYKNPAPYLGKKVLIIGMGNTGAEIALDLAEKDVDHYLSVRSPVNIVPRDVFGRPAQLTAKMLDKLPFGIGKYISRISTRLIIGDLTKYGITHAKMDPVDQLRTTGQTPVIDIGTVEQIKKGKIKIVPDIDHFISQGVILKNGDRLEVDVVILATGYKNDMDQLLENTNDLFDHCGMPKNCIGEGCYEGLYLLGFDNYKLGGLLGTIYDDSEVVAEHLMR